MMTQQTGFSILTTPLAAVDRRALSQAWYSALHLARGSRAAVPNQTMVPEVRFSDASHRTIVLRHVAPRHNPRAEIKCERAISRGAASTHPERRCIRSTLARKIEHTFLNPARRVQRATFSVHGSTERVHVSLQTNGNRVRLVAVCAPSVRAIVADALAQARYALAARGIEVTVC